MKSFILLKVLVTGLIFALALRSAARDGIVVTAGSVSVEAKVSESNLLVLSFSITNNSNIDLAVDKSQIPWTSYYALTLKAFQFDGLDGRLSPLTRSKLIADPPIGTLQIPAHKSVFGSVSLKRAFPEIEKALLDADLLVFWSFQIEAGETKMKFHGTLLIHSHDN